MVPLKEQLELGKLVHQLTSQHGPSASSVLALSSVCGAGLCRRALGHSSLEKPDRNQIGQMAKSTRQNVPLPGTPKGAQRGETAIAYLVMEVGFQGWVLHQQGGTCL